MLRNVNAFLVLPVLLLVAGIILFFQQRQNGTFTRQSGVLADLISTPYTLFHPKQNLNSESVVVLLHGGRCSSSMMFSFARMLARNGFKTYAIDLAGHGKSSVTLPMWCPSGAYPNRKCRTEKEYLNLTSGALHEIHAQEGRQLKNMIVIGHSWGGRLGHDLLKNWPLLGITPFLINLDGELTSIGYSGENLFTVRIGPYSSEENQLTVSESHLSIIQSDVVNEKVLQWLGKRFQLPGDPRPSTHFLPLIILSLCISIASFWAIGWLPILWPSGVSTRKQTSYSGYYFKLLLALAALAQIFISLALPMKHFWQWQIYFQNIYLFHLGIAGWLAGLLILGKSRRLPASPLIVRSLGLAAGSFLLLAGGLFLFLDQNLFHLGYSQLRAIKFFVYILLLLPICFILFQMSFRYRLVTWSIFLLLSTLGSKGIYLNEAVFLIFILYFFDMFAERLAQAARSNETGAIFLCFLLSWWAAAAYPTTTILSPSLEPVRNIFTGIQ
jgi:hypothetical protein